MSTRNQPRQLSQNCPTNLGHHPCPNLSQNPLGHHLTCENTTHPQVSHPKPLGHHFRQLFPQVRGRPTLSPLRGVCALRLTHTPTPPTRGPTTGTTTPQPTPIDNHHQEHHMSTNVILIGTGDDLDVAAGRCCPTCRHDLTPHNVEVWNAGYSVAMRHARGDIREAWDQGFTEACSQHTAQRRDPNYPITRQNPFGGVA